MTQLLLTLPFDESQLSEVPEATRLFYARLQGRVTTETGAGLAASGVHEPEWTKAILIEFRDYLQPGSKAWKALVLIAGRPKGFPSEDLYATLGLDRSRVPGTFGPFGTFHKTRHPELKYPYRKVGDLFMMDPEVAHRILEIEQEQAE